MTTMLPDRRRPDVYREAHFPCPPDQVRDSRSQLTGGKEMSALRLMTDRYLHRTLTATRQEEDIRAVCSGSVSGCCGGDGTGDQAAGGAVQVDGLGDLPGHCHRVGHLDRRYLSVIKLYYLFVDASHFNMPQVVSIGIIAAEQRPSLPMPVR
ncbi:hypothetical protein [Planobispora takensis]|uniref:hypothetical protein n=1 Tax=Planobispora takensis TaxID=1367882 RepID=UPI001941997C|nr:hypothetical protein [Planobispora takensis]